MKNTKAFTLIELLYPAPISRIETLRDDEARGGFTLIELLVVVLIIGILAAVALPQYQVAVTKARTVEAITLLNAIEKGQAVYKMANGNYATDTDSLDIEVDATKMPSWVINAGYMEVLGHVTVGKGVSLEWVWPSDTNNMKGEHRCIANSSIAQQVCKSVGGQPFTHPSNTDTIQYYRLP